MNRIEFWPRERILWRRVDCNQQRELFNNLRFHKEIWKSGKSFEKLQRVIESLKNFVGDQESFLGGRRFRGETLRPWGEFFLI